MKLPKRLIAPLFFFLITILPIVAINFYLIHRNIPANLVHASEDRFWFEFSNYKYGCLNQTGTVIIPPIYDSARPFFKGYAQVTVNNKSFFVDPNGVQSIVPRSYLKERFYYFIQEAEQLASRLKDLDIYVSNETDMYIRKNIITVTGNPLKLHIPLDTEITDNIIRLDFSEDGFFVKYASTLIEFYNYSGDHLYSFAASPQAPPKKAKPFTISDPPEFPEKSEELHDFNFYIIPKNSTALENLYLSKFETSDGLFIVNDKKLKSYGYYDIAKRQIIIPLQFDYAYPFYKGRAIVGRQYAYSMICRDGSPAINDTYDYISQKSGVYVLKKKGSVTITKDSKNLTFNTGYVFISGKFAWVTGQNTVVNLESFETINCAFDTPLYPIGNSPCSVLAKKIYVWNSNFELKYTFIPVTKNVYTDGEYFSALTGQRSLKLHITSDQTTVYDSKGEKLFTTPLNYTHMLPFLR